MNSDDDELLFNSDNDEPLGMNFKASSKKKKLAPPTPGVSVFKFVRPEMNLVERRNYAMSIMLEFPGTGDS
ncbi:hypothetical protein Leryth_003362 [Lithospermum erythrorhizon]|nr:hypothetical protein Leryth_003362 [Lithospermum erythrorhizon]